jgi:hypothetical protein
MNIALTLSAHDYTEAVLDSIDAIKKHVTNDILLVVDGAAWENWGKTNDFGVKKIEGFYHKYPKAPYRNVSYGLFQTKKAFPNADWYCQCEYDVLFTSSEFKKDLEIAEKSNVTCIGNDLRKYNFKLPYFERIVGQEIKDYFYLLGCCVFYHKNFMNKMIENEFFERFLQATNTFEKGYFPDYEEQGGYDFGETMLPTMANYYGGKVGQFAVWNQFFNQWNGHFKKYPMRWQPEIQLDDIFHETSILHPVKEKSELRAFYSAKRKRNSNLKELTTCTNS